MKDVRRRGLLTFLLHQDAEDFAPLVAYSNSTSPEETSALKVTEDAYHNQRFYTIRCTRKRLLLFSIVFLSLLVLSSLLTAAIFNHTLLNTCTSSSCVAAAEALRRNAESRAAVLHRLGSVDVADDRPAPCDDFYEYACAGWKENTLKKTQGNQEWNAIIETAYRSFDRIEHVFNTIINDDRALSELTTPQRDAFTTYKKCMADNVEDASAVYAHLYQEMQGWISTALNENSLEDVLVGSYRMNSISLFSLAAIVNPKENTHAAITLEESVPILGNLAIYALPIEYDAQALLDKKSGNPYLNILLTTGFELAELLSMEMTMEFQVGLANAILFDARLAKINAVFHTREDQFETTLGDLRNMAGTSFDFYEFMRSYMAVPSSLNTKIIVAPGRKWLYRLLDLLKEYEEIPGGHAIIKDYIKFKQFIMLYIHSGQLTRHKSPEGLGLLDMLYNGKTDRNNFCIKRVGMANQLGFVSLLEKFFGLRLRENMKYAEKIAESMRHEYIETLRTSAVVDERDRAAMIHKAESVRIRLAVPEASRDVAALNRESELMINDSLPWTIFFPTVMGNIHFYKMSRVHEPLNPDEWPADTNTFNINVHYNFESNSILFPILMMLDQFIDSSLPSFYSFGGIGAFVGHEMSHGFDFKGRLHGPTGLDQNLTIGETSRNYEEKQKCFQAQYKSLGEMRAEDAVLSENIADNVAIDLAFKAWKKNNDLSKDLPGLDMAPEKAFFMAYAQNWCALSKATSGTHSVEKLRVLGPLQNSASFAEAFSCPAGSFMNPVKKCSLW